MESVENLADTLERAVEVLLQLLPQLLARRLVLRVLLLTKGHPTVVHPADVFGMVVLVQAQQKVRDAPHRRRILAAFCREGPRDHGEERTVNERVTVYQKDARLPG